MHIAQLAMVDSVSGLPLHPLVVHAVVVLVPLAALGLIAISLVPRWSVRYGPLVWPLALVGLLGAIVAEQSGQALSAKLGIPAAHMQLGERIKYVAAAVLVMVLAIWLLDRRAKKPKRSIPEKILAAISILVALFAIYLTIRVGDSGARAVWG